MEIHEISKVSSVAGILDFVLYQGLPFKVERHMAFPDALTPHACSAKANTCSPRELLD